MLGRDEKINLSSVLEQKDYAIFHLSEPNPENSVWNCDCYAVKLNNQAVVIDPGYTRFCDARKELNKQGIDSGIILLTHGHWDHYYGAFDLLSRGFSRLYVHKEDHKYIDDLVELIKKGESNLQTNKKIAESLSGLHGVELNLKFDFLPSDPNELGDFEEKVVHFDERQSIPEYEWISAKHDGSHTKGHTTYKIGRVLFAGDLVLLKDGRLYIEPRLDHKETGIPREIREIRDATKTALRKIIEKREDIDYVCLGHGCLIKIDEFIEKTKRFVKC